MSSTYQTSSSGDSQYESVDRNSSVQKPVRSKYSAFCAASFDRRVLCIFFFICCRLGK